METVKRSPTRADTSLWGLTEEQMLELFSSLHAKKGCMATPTSTGDLAEAQQMEVFSRLSAKDLAFCKCLSKPFRRLVADPYFMKLHINHVNETNDQIAIFKDDDGMFLIGSKAFDQRVEINNVPAEIRVIPYFEYVVGSCNGIICISSNSLGLFQFWNPTTRECMRLRYPPFGNPRGSTVWTTSGFGYCQDTQEYKIIMFAYFRRVGSVKFGTLKRVMVYTLGINVWRTIASQPMVPFSDIRTSSHYVVELHGALHWEAVYYIDQQYERETIISFELETEQIGVIPFPDFISGGEFRGYFTLGVFEGFLSTFCYSPNADRMDIWVMRNYGVRESWTRIIFFEVPLTLPYMVTGSPLIFQRNGKLLFKVNDSDIISYDRDTHITTVLDLDQDCEWCANYVETLTSISSLMIRN